MNVTSDKSSYLWLEFLILQKTENKLEVKKILKKRLF